MIPGLGAKILQAKGNGKKNQANEQKILSDCSDGNQGQALPTATVRAHTHLFIWVTGPVTPRPRKPDSCCWPLVTLVLWEKQEVPELGSLYSEPGEPMWMTQPEEKGSRSYTNCPSVSGHCHSA